MARRRILLGWLVPTQLRKVLYTQAPLPTLNLKVDGVFQNQLFHFQCR